MDYLYDGELEAFNALYFIKSNYKQWSEIFQWLKRNQIKGKKLVEFFKNESDETGGGYHLGVTLILSRMKGNKTGLEAVKINELI